MSMINVSNLSFHYDNYPEDIFKNVSFTIDTNWKLGFIGRNGKGKTTFLNLLLRKYEFSGEIKADVKFDYFPFEITDKTLTSYEIAENINDEYEQWRLEKEVSIMNMDIDILSRPFETLSKGEQTRVLLAMLFIKNNNFLLIDEPTNHLDTEAREVVAKYLNKKRGFILVSHDRMFLDTCVDHILSINRANIEIQQGNFSSWWENKNRQDNFELAENEKLKKDINRLEKSAKQSASWANQIESSKYNLSGDVLQDKGYIGHKAAKMMKRSISSQNRKEKAIEDKSKLLKNIETIESLKLDKLENVKKRLIEAQDLSIYYDNQVIFDSVDFFVEDGDRLQIKGKNGSGKSSIIKLIMGENIKYEGQFSLSNNLKISYISQDTSWLNGSLTDFARDNNIEETLFKSILRKLDFEREQFEKNIKNYSEGQKKKVLIAKSLCEQANIYIWDEPLNYVDIFSRMQVENLIKDYEPTMIFVEHDEKFSDDVATKKLVLTKTIDRTKGFKKYL